MASYVSFDRKAAVLPPRAISQRKPRHVRTVQQWPYVTGLVAAVSCVSCFVLYPLGLTCIEALQHVARAMGGN